MMRQVFYLQHSFKKIANLFNSLGRAYKKEVVCIEIVLWRPFGGEIDSLRKKMDSLWNRFFGERPFTRQFTEEWSPSVDISENKKTLSLRTNFPVWKRKTLT